MEIPNSPPILNSAVPRPAASVLLLRDGVAGLEVFMATRHQDSSFMPGILVFPGGSVDAADADPTLIDEANAYDDLVFRIAAIREVFEEAAFLLARPVRSSELVSADTLERLLETYRARLCERDIGFPAMVAESGVRPAIDLLIPFAHWITPNLRPKRFNTRFYAARAPEGQVGAHDDRELIDSRWVMPADALSEADAGVVRLVFATRSNLGLLAKSATVAEALAAAASRRIVTVEPEPFDSPQGRAVRIPADAGYDITEILVKHLGL